MKTTDLENFKYRVNYAAHCLMKGIYSRSFNNCFEMYDGSAVVTALIKRGMKNEKLKQAIRKNWSEFGPMGYPKTWEESYQKYKNAPNLEELAKQLRQKKGEETSL